MVDIGDSDEENRLILMGVYLPDLERINMAWPRYPRELRSLNRQFNSIEEAAANLFTARARMRACNLRYERSFAMTVPIDTWVFGTPKTDESTFAIWFADEPEDTNLRVVLYRDPCLPLLGLWTGFFKHHQEFRRRHGTQLHLKEAAAPFLQEVLGAYREGDEAVEAAMRQTLHQYWRG